MYAPMSANANVIGITESYAGEIETATNGLPPRGPDRRAVQCGACGNEIAANH